MHAVERGFDQHVFLIRLEKTCVNSLPISTRTKGEKDLIGGWERISVLKIFKVLSHFRIGDAF